MAGLDARVEPRVYLRDGLAVTLWTYYRAVPPGGLAPAEYGDALVRLHAGMRHVSVKVPHFTERVAEAQWLVGHAETTPELVGVDRDLPRDTLRRFTEAVVDRGAGRGRGGGVAEGPSPRCLGLNGRDRAGPPLCPGA